MGHRNALRSKREPISEILNICKVNICCHPIVMRIFSLNWLCWDLLVVHQRLSSISYSFEINSNERDQQVLNLNFIWFHQILMQFFAKWSYIWFIRGTLTLFRYFISKSGLNFVISHIWMVNTIFIFHQIFNA